MSDIHFHVNAEAAPQGSKRGMIHRRTGNVVLIESSAKVKPYRDSVRTAAIAANGRNLLDGPVRVHLAFWFQRPRSHYGTGRNRTVLKPSAPRYHSQRPDTDKLIRSTLDALTGYLWRDDSQVARLVAEKNWTTGPSFVAVTVTPLYTSREGTAG